MLHVAHFVPKCTLKIVRCQQNSRARIAGVYYALIFVILFRGTWKRSIRTEETLGVWMHFSPGISLKLPPPQARPTTCFLLLLFSEMQARRRIIVRAKPGRARALYAPRAWLTGAKLNRFSRRRLAVDSRGPINEINEYRFRLERERPLLSRDGEKIHEQHVEETRCKVFIERKNAWDINFCLHIACATKRSKFFRKIYPKIHDNRGNIVEEFDFLWLSRL